jgi:hypothetical protein
MIGQSDRQKYRFRTFHAGIGKASFASKREKDASDMLAIFPRIRSVIADAAEGKHLGHKDVNSKFPGDTTGPI